MSTQGKSFKKEQPKMEELRPEKLGSVHSPGDLAVPRWLKGDKSDAAYDEFLKGVRLRARAWVDSGKTADDFEDYLVAEKRPLNEQDMCVMNSILFYTKSTHPKFAGLYRDSEVRIRDHLDDDNFMGEIIAIIPDMPKDQLSKQVSESLDILNNRKQGDDFVELLSKSHWNFVMETHPFHDLNGRSMRRMMNVFCKRWDVPEFALNPKGTAEDYHEWSDYMSSQSEKNPALYRGGGHPHINDNNEYRKVQFSKFMHKYYKKRVMD